MASVTIRNLDDNVVEALKRRARANNRSLEGELRQILADATRCTAAVTDLRTLTAMTPDRPQSDGADLLFRERQR